MSKLRSEAGRITNQDGFRISDTANFASITTPSVGQVRVNTTLLTRSVTMSSAWD
jgi:hypothetical protein